MDEQIYGVLGAMAEQAQQLQRQAEAAQRDGEALLAKLKAENAASAERMATLLAGMAHLEKSFAQGQEEMTAQIAAFTKAVDRIGPQAFAGGKEAVAGEVRAAFRDAGAALVAASEEASAPARAAMAANAATLETARGALDVATRRLSWKAAAMLGVVALAALATMALGGYGFVVWQNRALESRRQENLALETNAARLRAVEAKGEATIAEMRQTIADLDAKGARFRIEQCGPKGKAQLCVEIDPKAPTYGVKGGPQYRVPMGF